ncbi:MAG: riboflavin biosynthesis protein RibF [Puniceicoccales bacterium]|nr:riboflavin biosynthesis protein RibF [Puniceicoccales bacterium]
MHRYESLASLPALPGPVHLAIGMFDGVHLGHQKVIGGAVCAARQTGGSAAVLTFSPHPSRIFRPDAPVLQILSAKEKDAHLDALGAEYVIHEPFTPVFATLDAPAFLALLRQAIPNLAGIHIGESFRFGHDRTGNAAWLARQGQPLGLDVFSAPNVTADGIPVSSSRIRQLLASGDITGANSLLGYRYQSSGVVIGGRALGRTIGFPTLNLRWAPELLPHFGVYAVRARIGNTAEDWVPGVANYGLRPTVENTDVRPLLEVHLLAGAKIAAGTGPGQALCVEWLHFLRPEKKFSGLDALREQIAIDVRQAREMESLFAISSEKENKVRAVLQVD